MYTEKYKTLQRGIKDLNKWDGILYSWDQKTQYCKGVIFLKLLNRLNTISVKNLAAFLFVLVEIDKLTAKFIWKCREYRIAKLKNKNKVGGFAVLSFKT